MPQHSTAGASHTSDEVIEQIIEIAPGIHPAEALPPDVLRTLARHLARRDVRRSAETGAGASTLIFSHLSANHTVFAKDGGSGSIKNVQSSSFLGPGELQLVDGPTQRTLPRHTFPNKLQAVLLDGPHAYPFPDLEYYFLYPHIQAGGLLVLDDLQIKTVYNLFQFLRSDEMFALDEVVHRTAFFTRTTAPTFDPQGDGWWKQRYNQSPLWRFSWRDRAATTLPKPIKRALRWTRDCFRSAPPKPPGAIRIEHPKPGASVGSTGNVTGTARPLPETYLWVVVRREDQNGWWPQADGPLQVSDGEWSCQVKFGEPRDLGHTFEIKAVVVGPATHQHWLDWVNRSKQINSNAPIPGTPPNSPAEASIKVTKRE
jgi:hypothetical protein